MTWQFDVVSALIGFAVCPLGSLLLLVAIVYWGFRQPGDWCSRSIEDEQNP